LQLGGTTVAFYGMKDVPPSFGMHPHVHVTYIYMYICRRTEWLYPNTNPKPTNHHVSKVHACACNVRGVVVTRVQIQAVLDLATY
jgi:hypothetical protein